MKISLNSKMPSRFPPVVFHSPMVCGMFSLITLRLTICVQELGFVIHGACAYSAEWQVRVWKGETGREGVEMFDEFNRLTGSRVLL